MATGSPVQEASERAFISSSFRILVLTKLMPIMLSSTVLFGCADGVSSKEAVKESAPTGEAGVPSGHDSADPLIMNFEKFSSSIPGTVGVAIGGGDGVKVYGKWTKGPAWSTIKVPLAIAGLRQPKESTPALVSRAIEQSDNDAAMDIWGQLGDPTKAAAAVGKVLRDAGDAVTVVQSEVIRAGFTPFGQTIWSTAEQARFAAALPCLAESRAVLDDMRDLAVDHRWGLAMRADTATKGGWGPSENGTYLVRQLAVISTSSGTLGISLSAAPTDGRFDSGVSQVGKLAQWVEAHIDAFNGRTC